MAKVKELNERIKAKLDELEDDRAEREHARKVVSRRETRVEELREELTRARRRIERFRGALGDVVSELVQLEKETPEEDTEEEQQLRNRLDRIAGEYEEAVTLRDRLLNRLDLLQESLAEARDTLDKALEESDEDREALQRVRAKRHRIKERRDRPSTHFAYAEFDCNDGTSLPKQSEPAVRDWCERIGEPVRKKFGPVHINSGFRHKDYNARVGGESDSVHIYDYPGRDFKAVAVDFTCEQGTAAEWFAFTAGLADGRGRYATFHHADTRNRIGWSQGEWAG